MKSSYKLFQHMWKFLHIKKVASGLAFYNIKSGSANNNKYRVPTAKKKLFATVFPGQNYHFPE